MEINARRFNYLYTTCGCERFRTFLRCEISQTETEGLRIYLQIGFTIMGKMTP